VMHVKNFFAVGQVSAPAQCKEAGSNASAMAGPLMAAPPI
jgi:hypothetical protein